MAHLIGAGVQSGDMTALQVCVRALILYIASTALLRLADRRFLSRMSAIDIILGITIGGMISRAINGSGALGPTLVAVLLLLALHWIMAWASYHSTFFARLVKGTEIDLLRDGKLRRDMMQRTHINEADLMQQIREHGGAEGFEQIERVTLERGGSVSVVKKG